MGKSIVDKAREFIAARNEEEINQILKAMQKEIEQTQISLAQQILQKWEIENQLTESKQITTS